MRHLLGCLGIAALLSAILAVPVPAGGDSFVYQFGYRSGSYVASAAAQIVGTKLSSALVAGVVVYRLPSGQLKYSRSTSPARRR